MARNLFTADEIVLCTYAALYDEQDFGGINAICRFTNRSRASIEMKIKNIAAMLDEEGIQRFSNLPGLSGLPTGESGRRTNWDVVQPLAKLHKQKLLDRCKQVLI